MKNIRRDFISNGSRTTVWLHSGDYVIALPAPIHTVEYETFVPLDYEGTVSTPLRENSCAT